MLSPYEIALIQQISEQKGYTFKASKEYRVTVEIRLLPSGVIAKSQVSASSGEALIDAAALRATLAASPFPPPPKEFAEQRYQFSIELVFLPENENARD